MKNWAKVELSIINDERVNILLKKDGLKGFGVYVLLLLHCDCYNGMNRGTLELIGSRYGSRNLVTKIIDEYGLFETDADDVTRALARRPIRGSAEASASQHTGLGHCNPLKELELELDNTHTNEEEEKFMERCLKNYPTVMAMKKPLRKEECDKLIDRFSEEVVTDVLMAMENKPTITRDYSSAYLTLLSWCKRRVEHPIYRPVEQ